MSVCAKVSHALTATHPHTLRTLLKRRTNETTTVYTVHKDVQRPDSQARPQSFTLSFFSSLLPSTFVFLWLSSLAIRMISAFFDSWAPILFGVHIVILFCFTLLLAFTSDLISSTFHHAVSLLLPLHLRFDSHYLFPQT